MLFIITRATKAVIAMRICAWHVIQIDSTSPSFNVNKNLSLGIIMTLSDVDFFLCLLVAWATAEAHSACGSYYFTFLSLAFCPADVSMIFNEFP